MSSYWVVGGEYRTTEFRELVGKEVREGPFRTRAEAERAWTRLSWQAVDNCNVRFEIREDADAAAG